MTNRTVEYLRKSHEDKDLEAIGEMETLARHQKILGNVAMLHNLNIVQTYKEIVSGDSIEERPEMMKLVKELYEGKYTHVLVMEISRLARGNTKDQGIVLEALELSKTKIVTPSKIYDPTDDSDLDSLEMGLYLSRKELKAISKRMHSGIQQSVLEGNYLPPFPPYGYDIWKRGRRDRTLKPNDKAPIVKQIFQWALEGKSCGEIQKELMARGIPTVRGKAEWHRGRILELLKCKTYTGKIQWFRHREKKEFNYGRIEKTRRLAGKDEVIVVDGKHEAIIDQETFDAVQKNFGHRPPTNCKELKNVLAGIMRCKKCGRCIDHFVYHSVNRKPRYCHPLTTLCKTTSCTADRVIPHVYKALKDRLHEFEIAIENFNANGEVEQYKQEKKRLEKELKAHKDKRIKLFDLLESGHYTPEMFSERMPLVEEKIKLVQSAMNELKEPTESEMKITVATLSEVLQSLDDDSIPINKKNLLLKSVIERIDYVNDKGEVELDIFFK